MRNVRALFGANSAALLAITLFAGTAVAAPITGSGSNLPIPGPNPGAPPSQVRAVTTFTGGFTGTWTSPVLPGWLGSYTANGPIPAGSTNPTGLTRYDFSGLPNGYLPSSTYFWLGDLDGGSTTGEQFILEAFDAAGSAILTPWLDNPIGVVGAGTGSGGTILGSDMPGWAFNSTSGVYTFIGSTVGPGNPSIGVFLPSNVNITSLNVTRPFAFANFALYAPIPTPGTAAILGMGGMVLLRRRR